MGFDIIIHSPAVILIIAGVLFLTFNDNTTGWILVALGFLLAVLTVFIRSTREKEKAR